MPIARKLFAAAALTVAALGAVPVSAGASVPWTSQYSTDSFCVEHVQAAPASQYIPHGRNGPGYYVDGTVQVNCGRWHLPMEVCAFVQHDDPFYLPNVWATDGDSPHCVTTVAEGPVYPSIVTVNTFHYCPSDLLWGYRIVTVASVWNGDDTGTWALMVPHSQVFPYLSSGRSEWLC